MKKKSFDGLIRELKKRAKVRGGYVLNDEINEMLEDDFEVVELDSIYDRLNELKIEFYDDEGAAKQKIELREKRRMKKLKAEKKSARTHVKYDDPVRMYLREMGKVPLLDRQGEVRLAKRMEDGQLMVIAAIIQSDNTLREMKGLADRLSREVLTLDEVVQADASTWNVNMTARKEALRIERAAEKIQGLNKEIAKAEAELGKRTSEARAKVLEKMVEVRREKALAEFVDLRLSI
ncbi:MAG TPA: sigma-70 factor domain-containing protein, partial [Candidatus Krumholzibacteria bacterium]